MAKLLPKRLRQAKAQYHRQLTNQQHASCEKITKKQGPHLGLYCAVHGTWLTWIPKTSGSQQ